MTRDQFITRLEELYKDNVEISRRKNADYARGGDPFQNFKASEVYGVSVAHGIIVRMSDKMIRASNLLSKAPDVADESIFDTLSDLANYAMILRMWLEQKGGSHQPVSLNKRKRHA